MNEFIYCLGALVCMAGGVLIASALVYLACESYWRLTNYLRGIPDIFEAVEEWRERHPEKVRRRDGN